MTRTLAQRLRRTATRITWVLVNTRRLVMMLTALAMLFAPLAMQSGAAMAMPASDHHAQVSNGGHCDSNDQPDNKRTDKADMSCCVAMCSAVTIASSAAADTPAFAYAELTMLPDQFRRSFLAELPTPPPRAS